MFNWFRQAAKTRVHMSPREFRMILLASILLMIGGLAFVWPSVKMVKIGREYQILAQEQQQLLRENNLLRVERGSLQSLDRIHTLAEKHTDLKPAGDAQVVTIFLK